MSSGVRDRPEPVSEATQEEMPRTFAMPVTVPVPAAPPAQGGSAFPFDPQRLIGALRRRWRRLVLGTVLGLLLGAGTGFFKAKTRYEVSLELIKRYTQPTLQFGINGEPYKPRQFTNSTLASAARSPNVLERVASRFGHGITADALRPCILVKEDRTTDFVTLTLSGYQSAGATVELAKIWTEEVIGVTREMQSQDSGSIRKILETQLASNERELKKLDRETLELAGGGRILASDGQMDTFLHSQAEAEAKFETAQQELEAVNLKIAGVKAELEQLTPLSEELRASRAELDQLRTRYTDQNPIVLDRMEKIAALEAKLKSPDKARGSTDVNSLTGTFVSNALYLRLIELENQHDALEQQFQALKKKRAQKSESSGDSSRLMDVLQKKQTVRTAQSLLLSRLQEVRLYEENPPAFYGIFAPAELENVVTKKKPVKVAIYGVGGLFGGLVFSLGLVLVGGIRDPRLRTPGEAAKAMSAPLLGVLTEGDGAEETSKTASKLWMHWIGNAAGPNARPTSAPAHDTREDDIWRMLLAEERNPADAGKTRTTPPLDVMTEGDAEKAADAGGKLSARWSENGTGKKARAAWSPAPDDRENSFWRMMLAEAHKLLPALIVVNCGMDSPAALTECAKGADGEAEWFTVIHRPIADCTLDEARKFHEFIGRSLASGTEVWVRFSGPVQEPATTLARLLEPPLVLVPLHSTTTEFWKAQTELFRYSACPPCGILVLDDLHPRD